jgi:hypothetical protein
MTGGECLDILMGNEPALRRAYEDAAGRGLEKPVALADLWDSEHVSVAAGEPIEPAADALAIFKRVAWYAVAKLKAYYVAVGEGIPDRWNWKHGRLAAKRAVAVVCGLPAAEQADAQCVAVEKEIDAQLDAQRLARETDKRLHNDSSYSVVGASMGS